MTKISKHFSREEFACKCGCGFDTVDAQLLVVLESLRFSFDAPIKINSACRCRNHNTNVGGGINSQHLYGRAADIVVKGVSPALVYEKIEHMFPDHLGLGKYDTFTHVDTRNYKARW